MAEHTTLYLRWAKKSKCSLRNKCVETLLAGGASANDLVYSFAAVLEESCYRPLSLGIKCVGFRITIDVVDR